MKKILSFILAAAFAALLVGCANNAPASGTQETKAAESSVAESSKEESKVESKEESKEESSKAESSKEESEVEKGDPVDVDTLKKIEEDDDCKVKVTKKEIIEDAFSGFSMAGNDAIVLHITNNDSKAVSKVSIDVLAYDSDNCALALQTGTLSYFGNSEKYVKSFVTNDDVTIEPGATEEIALRTTKGRITGVRCIVSSYEIDGKEVKNDNAETWYKSAYIGKSSVLD